MNALSIYVYMIYIIHMSFWKLLIKVRVAIFKLAFIKLGFYSWNEIYSKPQPHDYIEHNSVFFILQINVPFQSRCLVLR